jgi:photosystem II stability/assembly factor-like uncharacterized protein
MSWIDIKSAEWSLQDRKHLVRADEPSLTWRTLSDAFGDGYLLPLASDPVDQDRGSVAPQNHELLASRDGGQSWHATAAP